MHGARVPTVGACPVAVVSTAFNLSFPTPATLEDIGQQVPWNSIQEPWRPTATGTLLRGVPPDLLSQSDDGLVRLLKMSLVSYCSCLSECASCSGTPRSLRRLNSSSGL